MTGPTGPSSGRVMARTRERRWSRISIPARCSSYPANLTAVGNTLFFTAIINDEAELWESDGTASGTAEVTSTNFGSFGQLIGIGGELYFTADDANGQLSLWQSDGTSAGTTILVDATGPADLINVDGSLEWVQYVPGSDGQQQQVGVLRSPGGARGPVPVFYGSN